MRILKHIDVSNLPIASYMVGPGSELRWSDLIASYSQSVIRQIDEYLPGAGEKEMHGPLPTWSLRSMGMTSIEQLQVDKEDAQSAMGAHTSCLIPARVQSM